MAGEVFVVLTPFTESNSIIYGRNSFTEGSQEIVYLPANPDGSGLEKLQNIEVEKKSSYAVILNKPGNLWGGESGSNEKKVTIGITFVKNEADTGILGTDILRLALERSSSANEAIETITDLITKHVPDDNKDTLTMYAFIICDPDSAWILNSVGKSWAAKKIEDKFKSIGSGITIGNNFDKSSEPSVDFSSYSTDTKDASWNGNEPSSEGNFSITNMFEVLRLSENAQTSHVSILTPNGICVHWFTGTPNPKESVFKPFIFTFGARVSPLTKIPEDDTITLLQKLHSQRKWENVGNLLKSLESQAVDEVNRFLNEHPGTPNQELDDLMKDCVEAEVKFYR